MIIQDFRIKTCVLLGCKRIHLSTNPVETSAISRAVKLYVPLKNIVQGNGRSRLNPGADAVNLSLRRSRSPLTGHEEYFLNYAYSIGASIPC